ncbi:hypothetical protein COCC4DRAFT_151582 [Bipolaris maydis ATCC 48331]|uniref:Uncharacterized protein n=2 Tax=Cochliobolus heterostrophus TaxID=5016 RepID=M2U8X7_COCH5|nr:uncharacterized protein COCC4DRAFT_151582 [Bipolaris maydis ATCC 48331]EMD95044.1 hypothetical protein COCHEDRAFT_1090970 [Bipolaris maydis C5]KAJ5061833.1 hypothetical protein J3E74DRAFT_267705 [Bipolaris maydis]ENI00060.1 hypothetical protein COCC4DRAFT_151582 [Bipolaris maydis ATCC 48331]KAJ6203439.1 hypothetical protein J3E72DRAFT_401918 [Bipolaris maydis]KAJ6214804.1 hypothetical protein PSV09DRAFT_1090970 [Bipolaris maydis]
MTTTLIGLPKTLTSPLLTALTLAPLITSTASLTHAYMEYLTTSAFLNPPPLSSRLSKAILASPSPFPSPPTDPDPETHLHEKEDATNQLKEANQLAIPAWFTTFFHTGIYSVMGLNTLTLSFSLANIYLLHPSFTTRGSVARRWYQIGALATVAHYAFVPLVGRSVKALVGLCDRGEGEGRAEEWLGEWRGWHGVRMGSVDLVGWGCFVVGVVEAVGMRVAG